MKKLLYQIFIICLALYKSIYIHSQIYINAIPKTGTHLIAKTFKLIDKRFYRFKFFYETPPSKVLKSLNNQQIIVRSHGMHTKDREALLLNSGYKVFFTVRDPRDQIISWLFWSWKKFQKNSVNLSVPNYTAYNKLSFDDLLLEMIENGQHVYSTFNPSLQRNIRGISEFYHAFLPWMQAENVYTIKFEDLVGPKGGGSEQRQINEIQKIANYINITLTFQEAKLIANKLFGETLTFYKGQIGSWKEYFKEEHKDAFKKVAGQLLIDLGYEKDLNW